MPGNGMYMRAVIARPPERHSARLSDVPKPSPGKGQVLLRTRLVGIDGTDREINEGIYGTPPQGCEYLILGHEAVGTVSELGPGVCEVREGEWVVPTVRRPDNCPNCMAGQSDMCIGGDYVEHGIRRLHGFASDFALCDASFLIKVPPGMGDLAVLLEPLSVGEKAVSQAFLIHQRTLWEPGQAFVIGAGPLGLLTAMALRLRDLDVWVAATRERDSPKAGIVRRIGAQYVNVRESPLEDFPPEFDIVIEASGKVEPAIEGLGLLQRSGVMCVLGNYREKRACEDYGRVLRNVMMANRVVFGSVNSNKAHFEMGIRDMSEIGRRYGDVLAQVITKRLRPEDFEQAFLPDRDDIKTVIDFG